ncbi:MAG: four helix bundle protein [Chitinophagales bacterium]
MGKPIYDLEDRLVKFAGDTILFANGLPKDKAGIHLGGQVIRSASSSALNYGEAQGAESTKDKIHKLGIVLKELKETRVALKILNYVNYGMPAKRTYLLKECNELVAIVASMIKNKKKQI